MITPDGFEIYYEARVDPASQGELDHDDRPTFADGERLWVENIFFPPEGGPEGEYTFFVRNFEQNLEVDSGWSIAVYSGGERVRFESGSNLQNGEDSTRFTITYPL